MNVMVALNKIVPWSCRGLVVLVSIVGCGSKDGHKVEEVNENLGSAQEGTGSKPSSQRDLADVKCMPYLPSPVFEDWTLERVSTEECISYDGIKKSEGEGGLRLHICAADGVSRIPLERKKLPVLRLLTKEAYIEALATREGDTIKGEVQVERILHNGVSFMMAVEFEGFTLRQLSSTLDSLLEAPVEPVPDRIGLSPFGLRCHMFGLYNDPVGWNIAKLMVPSWE